MKRPIETTQYPLYFKYDGNYFQEKSPDVFVIKSGGTETPITKKSDVLMEALMAGDIITKEEYEKEA